MSKGINKIPQLWSTIFHLNRFPGLLKTNKWINQAATRKVSKVWLMTGPNFLEPKKGLTLIREHNHEDDHKNSRFD